MSKNSVTISDCLPFEEIESRKIFFILEDMMNDEVTQAFKNYTKTTGVNFQSTFVLTPGTAQNGFWVVKKIE